MLLNSDNLRILLGNSGPLKKNDLVATDTLIKTIVQEEMCGKGISRAKKKKKKILERYPQEIEGLDGARRRLLVTNNLFDYASCVGLPRQNVDLIEQQYIRTRLGVKRFLKKFIQIIEDLYGPRQQLCISDFTVALERIGIVGRDGEDLFCRLMGEYFEIDNGMVDVESVLQLLNSWATCNSLVKLLGEKYGHSHSWERYYEDSRVACQKRNLVRSQKWQVGDDSSRATLDDLYTSEYSISSSTYNLPSLRDEATVSKGTKMIKSKSAVLSRISSTKSSSIGNDVNVLRHELYLAKSGLSKLNQLVDKNIAWVQSNCDFGAHSGHLSQRAKQKCQHMAAERIFHVFDGDSTRTLCWAMFRWRSALAYEMFNSRVIKYCKVKAIHMLTVAVVNIYLKCLSKYWSNWCTVVRMQIKLEKEAAAVMIQSVVRQYLSKIRISKLKLGKTAIVIQNLFRKVKAVKVVKEKSQQKMNVFAAMAIQKLLRRLVEMRKAKAELKSRKVAKAATKIQKVFRGMKGRERFHQISLQKFETSQKLNSSLDLDALAAAVVGQQKIGKTKKVSKKIVPVRPLKKAQPRLDSKSLETKGKSVPTSPPKQTKDDHNKPNTIHRKVATKTFSPAVKTVEIEIQTDDFDIAPLYPSTNIGSSSHHLDIPLSSAVAPDAIPNQHSIVSQTEDDLSIGSSIGSGLSDDAATAIQKVARGKIARKLSVKRLEDSKKNIAVDNSIKRPQFTTIDSTVAVTKIQKVARGKLARTISKKIERDSPVIIPKLPVSDVSSHTSEQQQHDQSSASTGRGASGRRSATPSKSSRTIKSGRSGRSGKSTARVEEHESLDDSLDIDVYQYSLGNLQGIASICDPELMQNQIVAQDVPDQVVSSICDPELMANQVVSQDVRDEHSPVETIYPDHEGLSNLTVAGDPILLNSEPSTDIEPPVVSQPDVSPSAESSQTALRPQSKGFFSGVTKGLKASLGFLSASATSMDRPHTTNSAPVISRQSPLLPTYESRFGDSSGIEKPHTAPQTSSLNVNNSRAIQNQDTLPVQELGVEKVDPESYLPLGSNIVLPKLPTSFSRDIAAILVQKMVRVKLARIRMTSKRLRAVHAQQQAAVLVLWAVVTIQRVVRGRLGRNRFHQKELIRKAVLGRKLNISAIKIQSHIRKFLSVRKVRKLRAKEEAKKKQRDWLESLNKRSTPNEHGIAKDIQVQNTKTQDVQEANPSSVEKSVDASDRLPSNIDDSKLLEIDSKLKILEDIERRIKESEEKVRQEALRAEERLQEQFRLLEERTRQAEAERLAREELMKLAVGPVSHQSPFSTGVPLPSSSRGGKSSFSTISSAPPTGRSAKDGPIPSNAPRLLYGGDEWVQLWDKEQHAPYWWCEKKLTAQWEQPGLSGSNLYDNRDDVSESGYESTGGMTDYSTDHEDSFYGDSEMRDQNGWTEYWDEQAQAKYWYNNSTGEASWTLPDGLHSAASSIAGSTASRPGYGNGWTSYIDDETGQMYWHNIHTGEVQWDY